MREIDASAGRAGRAWAAPIANDGEADVIDGFESALPERWVGGKGAPGVWQRTISEMPPHSRYFELFLGKGTILRKKLPASESYGVELDAWMADAWRTYRQAGFKFIQCDAMAFLKIFDFRPADLIYLDPPYLSETRSCEKQTAMELPLLGCSRPYYRHEFSTPAQHADLLDLLLSLRCRIMLAGYRSTLYDTRLSKWRSIEIPTIDRGGNPKLEIVWMNFPEPDELHDYRFLGTNFRERERILKKKRRWINKLRKMQPVERAAVIAAVNEVRNGTP